MDRGNHLEAMNGDKKAKKRMEDNNADKQIGREIEWQL